MLLIRFSSPFEIQQWRTDGFGSGGLVERGSRIRIKKTKIRAGSNQLAQHYVSFSSLVDGHDQCDVTMIYNARDEINRGGDFSVYK